ncbi:calcium-binding protein [Nocardioides immobilis]|uniref:calcium-binding protein n=1 Tax=Nocardioides immobilis TaxID=2049295 RepID=UPI0011C44290|nr:calcium-binding protein [Nocardioides immobilis]
MKRTIAAAVLAAALPTLPLAGPASAGEPMCRGQEATHVGVPGELLITSPGPDVIVTNGARAVRSLNGDDVICATGNQAVTITPGGGDDVVDARSIGDDGWATTHLGARGVAGSSGDDVYLGSANSEAVRLASGAPADRKRVSLGGGEDYFTVEDGYPGRARAWLGAGPDQASVYGIRSGIDLDFGPGRHDQLTAWCDDCEDATFNLRRGTIRVDGAPAGQASNIEKLEFDTSTLGAVHSATVIGNDAANWISLHACLSEVRAGAGNDDVYASGHQNVCGRLEAEILGGAGDDFLWGWDGRTTTRGGPGDDAMVGGPGSDTLRGGDGQDLARGGPGEDACRAELRRSCES